MACLVLETGFKHVLFFLIISGGGSSVVIVKNVSIHVDNCRDLGNKVATFYNIFWVATFSTFFLSCYIFHHFCVLSNRLDPNTGYPNTSFKFHTGIQMDAHFRHFWFSIRMSFEYGPFMIMWTKSVLNVLKPDRTLHNFTIWQQSIMWIWQILANSSTTLHFSKITWYLGFI